jgi:hypothetical protein
MVLKINALGNVLNLLIGLSSFLILNFLTMTHESWNQFLGPGYGDFFQLLCPTLLCGWVNKDKRRGYRNTARYVIVVLGPVYW